MSQRQVLALRAIANRGVQVDICEMWPALRLMPMAQPTVPSEIAYYYPEPYWLAAEGGWVKSLLLFFDEIAILLPEYMRGRHVIADPTLAGPLEELGLLRVLEPETFVDEATAAQLAKVIEALVEGG